MPGNRDNPSGISPPLEAECDEFRRNYQTVAEQIAKVVVGHRDIIDGVLTCLFVGGHALLEGVPGLGKTVLVRSLASSLDLRFTRIQFTPDLMPADILGTNILSENEHGKRSFTFTPGPIFGQIVLADEINRATPKTQSALLEAMQERQVTAGGEVRKLPEPFIVMATQNPLEQEGTYPLPESQLDRFFFKFVFDYGDLNDWRQILDRTTGATHAAIVPVLDAAAIAKGQELLRRVVIAPHVRDDAIRCALATHPTGSSAAPAARQYLRAGASPRAAQAIVLAAKARALMAGRFHVSTADVRHVALPALRHRVMLNFEAEANGIGADAVLKQILDTTDEKPGD